MNDTYVTMTGNVVEDPTLRRTDTGRVVANFRLASTPRRWDRQSSGYSDGMTTYIQVSCWGELGANVATSFRRGQPVTVHGRLVTREFTTKDEQSRTVMEVVAEVAGHNLAWGMAEFAKRPRVARPADALVGADVPGADGAGDAAGDSPRATVEQLAAAALRVPDSPAELAAAS